MNKPSSSTKGRKTAAKNVAAPGSSSQPSRPKQEGSPLGELDQHLFNEGTHPHIYRFLGAHPGHYQGKDGTWFGVWAPSAREVKVIGDFSGWQDGPVLYPQGASGIWHGFVPDVGQGDMYKYKIMPQHGHAALEKADPLGFHFEVPPRQASVVWKLDGYAWNDEAWMKERGRRNALDAPMSIYEVHLGSFMRIPEEGDRYLNYREAAVKLADRVEQLGFTHVELLPVMEHPFYGSWGYQVTGYFAPSSRYGTPQDLMYMIDYLHQRGIGVILDWVPAHFPSDAHGLAQFDGSHIYEHADPRQGFHPDWKSMIFNYGRHEVRSFLISSALFWLDKFHVDGLRVDGVASMLYLDYSREAGEWIPNEYGGRENLAAIQLLRSLNETVYKEFPDVQTIAEESTAWPMVSRPVWAGGLGFGLKWDMGWMHDTLQYMHREPIHRRWHHGELTFRGVYAFQENFVLPLSHDEVVHGKGSLLDKMPGDDWQKFANLRLLYAYMFATPGKKLLFMGGEFGQWSEWKHDQSLDWHLEESPLHRGVRDLVGHLARTYAAVPALHALDTDPSGFEWIDANDSENSVVSFLRWDPDRQAPVVVVFNFTPVPRQNYRIGVPSAGYWREVVNTDAAEFGGSGQGNLGGAEAHPAACHGRQWSLNLTLPPLGAIWLQL